MINRAQYDSNAIKLVAARDDFFNPHELPLKIGDFVRLNSGGPKTMIVDLDGSGHAVVSWFNEAGELEEASFPVVCLHRVSPLAR